MRHLVLPLLPCATAAPAECRLALALAVDVSGSIDAVDYTIQTEGMAAALDDAKVRGAILSPAAKVALAIYYWSGQSHQDMVQDWAILDDAEAIDRVAQTGLGKT